MKTFAKVPDLRLAVVKRLFADIERHRGFAAKNLVAWLIAAIFFLGINIWHLCNIFILENLPMTYIYTSWGQHVLVLVFWFTVWLIFNKMTLYMREVRKSMKKFIEVEKVSVIINSKNNYFEFNFRTPKM